MNPLHRTLATVQFLLLAALCMPIPAHAVDSLEQLRQAVDDVRESTDTVAVGVALIENGELVWLDAMGHANVANDVRATPDTLFRIGSTSKMFVGLSVLKLVDEGRVDLDATLRELAPEIVFENPWQAEHPVRLVHLLEHTSGWDDLRLVEYAHNEPSPVPLKEALLRHPGARTSRWVPGTRMAYSNAGPSVAAYIVEKLTDMRFEDYVAQALFKPLGMASATYFQPDGRGQLATGYTDGQALPYWHMMHRPAGAVNASPRDMANLVAFFLGRGQAHGERVLSAASIDRMETSLTTLGARQGLTFGYGLNNYPSGFKGRGIAFRGHAGGLPGATADLAYVPELDSGYAIMVTGDGSATHPIGELLRGYLLRNHPPPALNPGPLPESFRSSAGIYVPINPRSTRDSFLPRILGAMKFSTGETFLHRMPVLGGWEGSSSDYAIGENLLVDQWTGLPSVARVVDPIVGEAIQVGPDLYVRSSAARVWGEVAFLAAVFACSLVGVAWAALSYAIGVFRHRSRVPAPTPRVPFWPAAASLLLLACASQIELSMANMDMAALGRVSPLSIMIFALTAGYGLVAAWSAVDLFRRRKASAGWAYAFGVVLCGLHLAMVVHLARHGMIGLRTWVA